MLPRILTFATLGLLLVISGAPASEGKKSGTPEGTYERKAGDTVISLSFGKDGLKTTIKGGDVVADIESAFGITKKNVVFGIITKVKAGDGTDGPAEGHLFSFRVQVNNDTLVVSDLKGTDDENAKQIVEGEYKKVAGK